MKTKYGNVQINKNGYYVISSGKEKNNRKYLHRLIARDYFGDWIDEPLIDGERIIIHHIDGNKLNNCVLNLEPITDKDHRKYHMHNQNGENNYNYKPYATVMKKGFTITGKQKYGINFNGKEMWAMTDKNKLINRFCAEYPLEIIKKTN